MNITKSAWIVTLSVSLLALASASAADNKALIKDGKTAYLGTCASCHGQDPHKDGPMGPALQGVSKAVLQAKTLKGEYPAGYKPRRATKMMAPMPQMADKIDALSAYLSAK